MSVDLDRLREALTRFEMPHHDEVRFAAEAVLDAPTVWWCSTNNRESDPEPWAGSTRCALCDSDISDNECGWVALVPVKGGQE